MITRCFSFGEYMIDIYFALIGLRADQGVRVMFSLLVESKGKEYVT